MRKCRFGSGLKVSPLFVLGLLANIGAVLLACAYHMMGWHVSVCLKVITDAMEIIRRRELFWHPQLEGSVGRKPNKTDRAGIGSSRIIIIIDINVVVSRVDSIWYWANWEFGNHKKLYPFN